jgi:hypothetical protein
MFQEQLNIAADSGTDAKGITFREVRAYVVI